jgi:hypothetical protein
VSHELLFMHERSSANNPSWKSRRRLAQGGILAAALSARPWSVGPRASRYKATMAGDLGSPASGQRRDGSRHRSPTIRAGGAAALHLQGVRPRGRVGAVADGRLTLCKYGSSHQLRAQSGAMLARSVARRHGRTRRIPSAPHRSCRRGCLGDSGLRALAGGEAPSLNGELQRSYRFVMEVAQARFAAPHGVIAVAVARWAGTMGLSQPSDARRSASTQSTRSLCEMR